MIFLEVFFPSSPYFCLDRYSFDYVLGAVPFNFSGEFLSRDFVSTASDEPRSNISSRRSLSPPTRSPTFSGDLCALYFTTFNFFPR